MSGNNGHKTFTFADVSSYHSMLSGRGFYGTLTARYEQGQIVLLKLEETIKPPVKAAE